MTLEEWNIFKRRWDVFVSASDLDPDASSSQLFQCAGDELGDNLLKTDPSIVSKPTSIVTGAMKSLAVIVVATGVLRAELVRMQQKRDESLRTFAARVRGKAETCAYITKCLRDHRKNVLRPLTSWPMRPTTPSLRGSGAEPAS